MNKLHRQLVVLCIQHEEEWNRALKSGKIVFGVGERDGKYLVIINWYTDSWEREQIVVCAVDDSDFSKMLLYGRKGMDDLDYKEAYKLGYS